MVDEAMFTGNAVSLVWSSSDVDGPCVGVNPLTKGHAQPRHQQDQQRPMEEEGRPRAIGSYNSEVPELSVFMIGQGHTGAQRDDTGQSLHRDHLRRKRVLQHVAELSTMRKTTPTTSIQSFVIVS
jgi:hypothetical protein